METNIEINNDFIKITTGSQRIFKAPKDFICKIKIDKMGNITITPENNNNIEKLQEGVSKVKIQ